MTGAVVASDDSVLSFEQHVTLLVGQHSAKGMIAMFARTASHVDGETEKL
jgi:hypothetical protein